MAKKIEVEKLSPAKCLTSLREFHERVILLVLAIEGCLPHIDEKLKPMIQNKLDSVREFYES